MTFDIIAAVGGLVISGIAWGFKNVVAKFVEGYIAKISNDKVRYTAEVLEKIALNSVMSVNSRRNIILGEIKEDGKLTKEDALILYHEAKAAFISSAETILGEEAKKIKNQDIQNLIESALEKIKGRGV